MSLGVVESLVDVTEVANVAVVESPMVDSAVEAEVLSLPNVLVVSAVTVSLDEVDVTPRVERRPVLARPLVPSVSVA